jgi:hypothetical protein
MRKLPTEAPRNHYFNIFPLLLLALPTIPSVIKSSTLTRIENTGGKKKRNSDVLFKLDNKTTQIIRYFRT